MTMNVVQKNTLLGLDELDGFDELKKGKETKTKAFTSSKCLPVVFKCLPVVFKKFKRKFP